MTGETSPGGEPQPVLGPLTTAAIFLVVTVDTGGAEPVRELLADLSGLERAFGFGAPEGIPTPSAVPSPHSGWPGWAAPTRWR